MIVTRTVGQIPVPAGEERSRIQRGPVTAAAFAAAYECFEALHALETRAPPIETAPLGQARIGFWNAERLKYLAPSTTLLQRADADALLLCELDHGMARSGNRHTLRELAGSLDAGYVFGAEFVELDLGDARERHWHRGEANEAGLHGAGILARGPLARPALVRLETSGRWFDGTFGERRVGGRMAVMAELEVAGRQVLLVSVHYESHSDPADRLAQTETLLDAIERHSPGSPVLIGGDFNTSTFDLPTKQQPRLAAAALRLDPERLLRPERYEPMFECLRRRGFEWATCNVLGAPTQRTRPDGTPEPPFGKIDWFFARGLACSHPTLVPAVDQTGAAISDHELLLVTVTPA